MKPVGIAEEMMQAGYHHGANIARVTKELAGKQLMATGNLAPPPEVLEIFSQN